jgi:hypothetical protein
MMKKHWLCACLVLGCGGRPSSWDSTFTPTDPVGLDNAVAVLDPTLDRALVLTSPSPLVLAEDSLPIGQDVVSAYPSPDGKRLFVLSRGVSPRRNPSDERPRLTVIETDPTPRIARIYEFNDPLSGLVLDPQNEWAVLYVTSSDSRPVSNPNEILLVNLTDLKREPIAMTVQSISGSPQSFSFTSELSVPNGDPRRLLVIETQNEVTLVDLSDSLGDDERATRQVTIPMPENQQGATGAPAEIAFHDATGTLDSELAVRLANDTNVLLLPLAAPAAGSDRPFHIEPNLVDVGGEPSTIHFVNTDAGTRLVALVGTNAALVDPATSNVLNVSLSKAFTGITLVTSDLASDTSTDIALLWSSTTPTVGLWDLGAATTTATHGLHTLAVGASIRQVLDVPGDAFTTSKILQGVSGDFYVLDLVAQRSSPMLTNGHTFQLTFAPDGQSQRLWAFTPSAEAFASIDLGNLNPNELNTERPIWDVFDIAQSNGGVGRTAIVLHQGDSGFGATLFDAIAPDTANTSFYSGLAYGGLTHD